MRSRLLIAAAVYLALAVLGHAKERRGDLRCHCAAECWCKRPGIALFRWVLPVGHKQT